jgi:hypothetical protein
MSAKRTETTTSRRQGQTREGMSGGSPSANVRADGQKPHGRLGPRASQYPMTKPARCGGSGQCGGCARKVHILIRGDRSRRRSVPPRESNGGPVRKWLDKPSNPTGGCSRPGSRTAGQRERVGHPTGPDRDSGRAPDGNVRRDGTEVSRRHGRPTPAVMGGTG